MATFTVTTELDVVDANDNLLSLREAVALANANPDADTIDFAAALATQTITLSSKLVLAQDVTIDGDVTSDGKADVTISGGGTNRIFDIAVGKTVNLQSLTLEDGNASGAVLDGVGGAILNFGTLVISDTTIKDSIAADRGGAIHSFGTMTIIDSTLAGNSAAGFAGAISSQGGTLTLNNATLTQNTAVASGGAMTMTDNGTLSFINSTITGNSSVNGVDGVHLQDNNVITVTNSVIAGNGGSDLVEATGNSTITATNSIFGSNVSDLTGGVNGNLENVSTPALGLGTLADNGGTVQTINIIDPDSVLINAGSDAGVPPGLTEDANGAPRIIDTVDVGATEFTQNLVVDNAADEDDGDYSAGDLSLREAAKIANQNADANTITFDASLTNQTITLTLGELALTQDVTIDGDTTGDDKADITISGNDASRVFNITGSSTDVDLLSLTLTDGSGPFSGGAIEAKGASSIDLADVTISNSTSAFGGGALNIELTTSFSIENSSFYGNSGNGAGGALQLIGTTGSITNSTFHDNSATSNGGGISIAGGSVSVLNTTVTGNQAETTSGKTTGGGGISAFNNLSITNSVVAGNTSGTGLTANDVNGTITTATNSVFGTNAGGVTDGVNGNLENVSIADLGLGTLADNGGTVQTINIIDPDSVLLDAGSNAALPVGLTEDANGNPRIERGTVDVGATEYVNQGANIATTALSLDENTVDAGMVAATDPEGDSFTFTVSGGADGALFGIDANTGALSFLAAPDFEAPGDAGGNNVYDVEITTTDQFGDTDVQTVAVTVGDASEAYIVTTADDVVDANDGVLSLREAVALANAGTAQDTITFDKKLAGETITLTQGELALTNDVIIDGDENGDNKADITISGNDASRIMSISGNGTDVDLLSLTLTDGNGMGGYAGFGGAILNFGNLTVIDSTIKDSTAVTDGATGGGIHSYGQLSIANSTIAGNQSSYGGAINASSAIVSLTNTTISGNTATTGIINAVNTTLSIESSTIVGNTSSSFETIIFYDPLTLTIENSVVAQNTTAATDLFANSGATLVINNSVFGTDVTGVTAGVSGNLESVTADQLKLGELLDNRGTVLTRAPLDGSILIGIGAAALLPLDIFDIDGDGNVAELLPKDATGENRTQNGTLDVGAVEYTRNETIGGTDEANTIVGGLGKDKLSGLGGDDTMTGGSGRDRLSGGTGADSMDGGQGSDTAEYKDSSAGVIINLQENTASGGDATGDSLVKIENLVGSDNDDTLTGNARKNTLVGGDGADTLTGLDGADLLKGGDGADTMVGGAGHDKLYGGTGADTFVLTPPLPTAIGFNDDLIFDFEVGTDTLAITQSAFGTDFTVGVALTADQFVSNAAGQAEDGEDRFILDTTTGALYFDGDGSGTTLDRYLLATFKGGIPALTEADFTII